MIRLRGIYMIPLFIGIIILSAGFFSSKAAEKSENIEQEAYEVMGAKTIDVILQRVYVDGEKSEERIKETIWAMEDFWALYDEWSLVDQNENEIIFIKEVNDISPLLKLNGYFGLTGDGILTIYEGEPDHENVIQSFFQIDTDKLKSHHYQELKKGIPVEDLYQYQKVLQVFGEYKASPEKVGL